MLAVDAGKNAVLILLDLTAAFDNVGHNVLIWHLEYLFGVRGTALRWFISYLKDRLFSVELGKISSSSAPIISGVPQGFILGLLLFNLCMHPLGDIIRKFHFIYMLTIPLKAGDSIQSLLECISDIKGDLLCKNHLYKVFEHSCVAAVCENNQPIMVKIHPLIFL